MIGFITFADQAAKTCTPGGGGGFFGLPHWWEYAGGVVLPNGTCAVHITFPAGIWAIGLAILDIMLYIAGIIAVVAIIIAGVRYVISAGSSDKTTAARKGIINAIVGLAIVMIAARVVAFIGGSLK